MRNMMRGVLLLALALGCSTSAAAELTLAPGAKVMPAHAPVRWGQMRDRATPWLTVLVGGATLVQAFFSVVALRGLRHARRSADAAAATLAVMQETSERQLRPYMFCGQTEFSWYYVPPDKEKVAGWRLKQHWKNSGATPALEVETRLNWQLFPAGVPPLFQFVDSNQSESSVGAVGPGQVFESRAEIPIDTWMQVHRGEAELHFWQWVEYEGLRAGKFHRTEIHFRIFLLGDPSDGTCNFQVTFKPGFNGSDDDCFRPPGSSHSRRAAA